MHAVGMTRNMARATQLLFSQMSLNIVSQGIDFSHNSYLSKSNIKSQSVINTIE